MIHDRGLMVPRVSVIIPCYNSEKYITECINSLMKQSFKDFNIIIVDDCSTDHSAEKILECQKKSGINIEYYKNDENKGPSTSRRIGISHSGAEYIAFCDSDDMVEIDFLEKLVVASEGSADVVMCDYNTIYPNKKIIRRTWLKEDRGKSYFIANGPDSLCCLLVKKNLLDEISFPNIRNGEDMAIVPVIMSKADRIRYVKEALYNYIYRKGSLSGSSSDKMLSSLEKSFDYIYDNLYENYREECVFLGIRNYLYGSLLNLFKYKYDKEAAENILSRFNQKCGKWQGNRYYAELPFYKRLYLREAYGRHFILCWILSRIHRIIT